MTKFIKNFSMLFLFSWALGATALLVITSLTGRKFYQDFQELKLRQTAISKEVDHLQSSVALLDQYSEAIKLLAKTHMEQDGTTSDNETELRRLQAWRQSNQISQNISASEMFYNMDYKLSEFNEKISNANQVMRVMASVIKIRGDLLHTIPSITPANGWISSNFGSRKSPFNGEETVHKGIDIGADIGTPIKATAAGVIKFAGNASTFGNMVVIEHSPDLWTKFAHTSKVLVHQGQYVKRGQIIAEVGNSGLSTGSHLHYEVVVNGTATDPLDYLLDRNALPNYSDVSFAPSAMGGE